MLQNIFSIKIHDTHNFGVNSTTFIYTNVFPHLISAILDLCFHIAYIFTVTVHSVITLSVKDGM